MSDLRGLGDPADVPGVAGDPALPPPPDDSLLRDFLQARALAQHLDIAARLDAFAAAHEAAMDEAPDGGGVGVRWGATNDDPDPSPASAAAPHPAPVSDPAAASDAVLPDAPSAPPAAPTPQQAAAAEPAPPQPSPPASLNRTTPTGLPSGLMMASGSGPVQSAIDLLVPGAVPGREAGAALKAGNYRTAALKELQGVAEAAIAIGTLGEGSAVLQGARAVTTKARSFRNFDALKTYLGSAGAGMQWHHIVEQSQIPQFGAEAIHNVQNLVAVPTEIHEAISAFYSSKPYFTDGVTVREWLRKQSFAEQYEFGVQKLAELLGY